MSRRFVILSAAVAAPALVLAVLSWRALRQEAAERRDEVRRRARSALLLARGGLESEFRRRSDAWWREAGATPEALVAFARERAVALAVRDARGAMLYPRPPEPAPSLDDLLERESPDRRAELARAYALEFAGGRPAEAAAIYASLEGEAESSSLRAALLHARARAARRAERDAEARAAHDRLRREFGGLTGEAGVPYGLLAQAAAGDIEGLSRGLAQAGVPGHLRALLLRENGPAFATARALERVEEILAHDEPRDERLVVVEGVPHLLSFRELDGAVAAAAIPLDRAPVPPPQDGIAFAIDGVTAAPAGELLASEAGMTAYVSDPRLLETPPQRTYLTAGLLLCLLASIAFGLVAMMRTVRHELRLARLKGDFVSGVSHELKTPLTSIRMFAEMLETECVPDAEKRREYYRLIHREALRLSRLVENVLDFARIEEGRKSYDLAERSLNDAVAAAAELFRAGLDGESVAFRVNLAEERLAARVDADALVRAILDLLDNAAKYGGGEIELAMARAGSAAEISVRDNGPGIPEKERARIFEKFYRGPSARSGPTGGAGLGLTLVKQTMEAHGGTVAVESTGAGARFILRLPLCPGSSS